ncbi:MAG: hypothetical protein Q9213_002875 [Squamulea squamosa]
MAWVRPKHPPPKKPKPDPVVTLLPMLSYFSSSRPPPLRSPTKPRHQDAPNVPLSRDPIIRQFQQIQAHHEVKPTDYQSVLEEPPTNHLFKGQPQAFSLAQDVEEDQEAVSKRARRVRQHHREPSPPPPPPPPLARPQPRVASPETWYETVTYLEPRITQATKREWLPEPHQPDGPVPQPRWTSDDLDADVAMELFWNGGTLGALIRDLEANHGWYCFGLPESREDGAL